MRAYTTTGEFIDLIPGIPLPESVKCYFIVTTDEETPNTNVPLEVTFNYGQEVGGVKSETYNLSFVEKVGDNNFYTCTWYPIVGIGELDDSGSEFTEPTLNDPVITIDQLTNDNTPTASWVSVPRADSYRVIMRYSDLIQVTSTLSRYQSEIIYDVETTQLDFTPNGSLTPVTSLEYRPIPSDGTLPDGKYSITIKAKNTAGEFSEYVSEVFTIKTSQTAPNSWSRMPVTTQLSLNGADGIPYWRWNMFGGTQTNLTVLRASTPSGSFATVKTIQIAPDENGFGAYTLDETADGYYKISLTVEDSIGNVSDTFEYEDVIRLDSTPPTVSNLTHNNDGTSYTMNWDVSQDVTRSQIEIKYTDYNTQWGSSKLPEGVTTFTANFPYETNLTIGVRVSDDLDNWSELITTQITTPAAPPEPPVYINYDDGAWSWGTVLDDWDEVEYSLNDGDIVRSYPPPPGVTEQERVSYLSTAWGLNQLPIDRTVGLNYLKVRVIVGGVRSEWRESAGVSVTSPPESVSNLSTTSTESPVTWTWDAPTYSDTFYIIKIDDVEQDAAATGTEYTATFTEYGTYTISVTPYRLDANDVKIFGSEVTDTVILADPNSGEYDIENLPYLIRYQLDDIVATDTVEKWTDSSGNNLDLTQRYLFRHPTYTAGGGVNFNVDRATPLWNESVSFPDSFCMYLVCKFNDYKAAIDRSSLIKIVGGPKIYDGRTEPQQSFSVGVQSSYVNNGNPTLLPVEYQASTSGTSWLYPRVSVSNGYLAPGDKVILVIVWQKGGVNIFSSFMASGAYDIRKSNNANYGVPHPGIELAGGMFGDYAANMEVFEFGAFEITSEITDLHNDTSVVVDKTVAELANRNNITTNAIYWNNPYIT